MTASLTASLTATTAVAAAAILPLLGSPPPAGATAYALQQVTAGDLGPSGSWLRLQDTPATAGLPAGVQQVVPFADPAHFDGSLHLAVTAGKGAARQAQAVHPFNRKVPLSGIASLAPSYDLYVRSWTSTASAVRYGASLQLLSVCRGAASTLSFQPQLAVDAQGRTGAIADTWRHFVAGPASLWVTSRPVGSFAAGTSHPLSAYASACDAPGDGATAVAANVGGPRDAKAGLDTYVDNIAVNGTVYEFTAAHPAGQARITMSAGSGSARPAGLLSGSVTFSSPSGGPEYTSVGTRLVFSRPGGLAPDDLTVTAGGSPVTLTSAPGGTLAAVVTPGATVDLGPGGAYRTAVTVSDRTPGKGALSLTAHLLAQGYQPLQDTGVHAEVPLAR
ncbi:hypothetical protein [Actinacidiphila acidipaludis]|uniref:Uncharacterized protein n=1 Tax=Actinacidiphila acidipaludis TaxID=2873382 RepID=A0ABS7QL55_9ACTN|nr:hypothetical protein [Streptomyces acidipaludis]MBY8883125.1 hypothetical protein [Streptomyces acidipaludis]